MYKILTGQLNVAEMQKEILEKWKKEGSFKTSIESRKNTNEFVFYDGPPFANGLPHYGHLLTSYIKDSVARFQTMNGKKTERRFGWDCHGLPAEMETEKELKVSGRSAIMEYGIENFNNACRTSVMKYAKEWEQYIEKAGRWVDFEEDYKTMDASYMESVLWGFKQLYNKGFVYEDYRVMPYSWKCETPLSNFETRMDNSYRPHTSKTAVVKISLHKSLVNGLNLSALIWTTTPWTLPSNLAIAVNKNIEYVVLKISKEEGVIIAKKLASKYEKELGNEVVKEFKGEELLGITYQPLFRFFEKTENAFKIIHGDFVEDEGGTGLVHIAPGFGEDDYAICKEAGIKIVCPVDDAGKFTSELYPYMELATERLEFIKIKDIYDTIKQENKSEENTYSLNKYDSQMKVILKQTGEVLGIAGFIVKTNLNVEVVCDIKEKTLWQEAMKFLTKYAFASLNVENIIVYSENREMPIEFGFKEENDYLILSKLPEKFKLFGFEFTLEGQHYNINNKGKVGIVNGFLEYELSSFTEQEKHKILNEFLERFAFGDVKTEDKSLKNLGFFEVKGEKTLVRTSNVLSLANRQVFETNDDIIFFLKQNGRLIRQEQYIHNYPHCWRTDTPLIYKAVPSWYVAVTKFKDRMVELNKQVNWMPSHLREGQFGKWLENARDWSITRNRFWGTPVPVWRVLLNGIPVATQKFNSELQNAGNTIRKLSNKNEGNAIQVEYFNIKVKLADGTESFFPRLEEFEKYAEGKAEVANISFLRNYVFGSIKELEEFFGKEVKDLHRPYIDDLKITDPYNKNQEIVRVTDVLDCWFESGSMPFASVHYPFENKDWFESHNPADFITEYVGQVRGWFYTLCVLGTAIFDKIPFKNCLCHGLILDENGQKLSKRLRNYPDPLEMFEVYGSDAMRFFLLSSTVVTGGDLNISRDGGEIRDVVRLVIKPIWNAYSFFAMYANADGIKAEYSLSSVDIMDIYILSKLETFTLNMRIAMEKYNFPEACDEVEAFIDVLNNWYIRRNKERFWKEEKDADKLNAYNTLWTVLLEFCKVIAPILPFTAESLFTNLNADNN